MGTIRHFSVNSRLKKPILSEGVLIPVFSAINNEKDDIPSVDLLRQCAAVLANIAENAENQLKMVVDGVLTPLVHLAVFDDPNVQEDVARCMALLSSNPDNQVGIFGAPEVKALLFLCDSRHEKCRRDALMALGEDDSH
jgi:hypothetical protein